MSQSKSEMVKQLAAAWNRDDLDAFLHLLDPDIEWNTSIEPFFEGTDSVFRGHEGIREFWESQVQLTSEIAQLWTFRGEKIVSSNDFLSHGEGLKAAGLTE
jgi:ketosteroid isomerase-like protein